MEKEKIIQLFIEGNRVGFDKIYEAYSSGMYAICRRYLRCDDDANDVLQESFIKVYNSRDSFDATKSIGAWIKTITIRTAINYIRKNYKHELVSDERRFDIYQQEQSVVDDSNDLKEKLTGVLEKLPEGYRRIFQLYAIENLTHKEIAAYLGVSEGTSKSQYSKAKKMIQKLLETKKIAS